MSKAILVLSILTAGMSLLLLAAPDGVVFVYAVIPVGLLAHNWALFLVPEAQRKLRMPLLLIGLLMHFPVLTLFWLIARQGWDWTGPSPDLIYAVYLLGGLALTVPRLSQMR